VPRPEGPGADRQKKVLRAAEQDRPEVAQQRRRWREARPDWDPEHLVFLDETWARTNLTRRSGRRPRGRRLILPVPHGPWKTTTLVAGLRARGLTAPLVVDGAVNGELFEADVRPQRAPTLGAGAVVVRDHLAPHQRAGVTEAIEAAGAQVRYLPPYSPDLNPIEQAFAKLQALRRRAGERTVAGLWRLLGQWLDEFSPEQCRNFFRHCGYNATPT
jgi:transposase